MGSTAQQTTPRQTTPRQKTLSDPHAQSSMWCAAYIQSYPRARKGSLKRHAATPRAERERQLDLRAGHNPRGPHRD